MNEWKEEEEFMFGSVFPLLHGNNKIADGNEMANQIEFNFPTKRTIGFKLWYYYFILLHIFDRFKVHVS